MMSTPSALLPLERAAESVLPAAAHGGAGFWSLLFAFVSGGLFFSTVVTAVAAVYAFGLQNCKAILSAVLLVTKRVWKLAVAMLRAAWTAIIDNRWADARTALREGFQQARQAAVEGVDAIKLEASLYAAAVGIPGLAVLQYALDRVTPRSLVPAVEKAVSEGLDGIVNPNVRRLRLKRFKMGSKPPRLMAARLYDLGPETIATDVDVEWMSDLSADIEVVTKAVGARVPVAVRNLRFTGQVRLMVTQLQASPPGYGAILVSFPAAPSVGFDVRVAGGELTKLPWLRSELQKVIQSSVAEQLLWPRRMVIPAELPAAQLAFSSARPFLSASQLDALQHDDPLLQAERALAAQPALREDPRRQNLLGRTLKSSPLDLMVSVAESLSGERRGTAPANAGVANATESNGLQWWDLLGRLRGGSGVSTGEGKASTMVPDSWRSRLLPRRTCHFRALVPDTAGRAPALPDAGPAEPASSESLKQRCLRAARAGVLRPSLATVAFKPPVGLMASLQLYQALRRKSILEDASRFFPTSWSQRRSLYLDAGDREYELEGGVHFVRVELYRGLLGEAARSGITPPRPPLASPTRDSAGASLPEALADALADETRAAAMFEGLGLSCGPGQPREEFVRRSSEQLQNLRNLSQLHATDRAVGTTPQDDELASSVKALAAPVEALIELRSADSMLRLLRDKLLFSAKILEQEQADCQESIRSRSSQVGRWFFGRVPIERARRKLAVTSALLERQLEQLGAVQHHLLTRPSPLSASVLARKAAEAAGHESVRSEPEAGSDASARLDSEVLDLAREQTWAGQARAWTRRARRLVSNTVSEVARSVAVDHVQAEDMCQLAAWADDGGSEGWLAALGLVEGLPQAQQAQRNLLPGYTYVYSRVRAVPSSVGGLALSLGVHYTLKPRWPEIARAGQTSASVLRGIYARRFYAPLRDIALDLLNRRPRLTDAAALQDSERSLETMLAEFVQDSKKRSRGSGGREDALAAVSRAYESEIKRGAIRNIMQGKLVRLILIQVQLLKTELLKAMGAIDDLVDANRLNVQLLASVPALLLLAASSHFSFTALHMLRTRGLRSMRQVHQEMGDVLGRLERCLLLAGTPRPQAGNDISHRTDEGSGDDAPSEDRAMHEERRLQGAQLGEFALHLHSFLLLLDFSSPTYPTKASDAIHHEVQDLLHQGQLSVSQQAAMLRSLVQRHAALAKFLR